MINYRNFKVMCEVEVQVSAVESEDRAKRIAESELRQGKYGHMKMMNVVVRRAEEVK
jgi:hypothetical protein